MIRHLLKLVWNRKRANGLIMLEMFFSFLVVFALITLGAHLFEAFRRPLGFSYDNVWTVRIGVDDDGDENWLRDNTETLRTMLMEVEAFNEVEAAAAASGVPYDGSQSIYHTDVDGQLFSTEIAFASDRFADVVGLDIVQGRWFREADAAMNWIPVVIDLETARDLFGEEDPIGKTMPTASSPDHSRIVGVIGDFRKGGEFEGHGNFMFERRAYEPGLDRLLPRLVLRVRPGVTAEFEGRLVQRLESVSSQVSFDVQHLEQMRRNTLNLIMAPLVAVFLMLMVALGLTGVLWQNVTQRTREIGLRRAAGAREGDIHLQILTELWLVTTVSLVAGTLIVLQVPLLQLLPVPISSRAYATDLALSLALIYMLSTVCALYPSRVATRIPSAAALHYE